MQGLVKTAIQAKGRPRCSKSITCKLDPSRYVAIRLAAIDKAPAQYLNFNELEYREEASE